MPSKSKQDMKDMISFSDDAMTQPGQASTGTSSITSGSSVVSGSIFETKSSSTISGSPPQKGYSAPAVAKKEQKFVFLSKILVVLVLVLAVCVLATTTYTHVTAEEKQNFESQVRFVVLDDDSFDFVFSDKRMLFHVLVRSLCL